MFRFWVFPGVNSKVASHLDVVVLYTKTMPFWRPEPMSTSLKPVKVDPPPPLNDERTFTAFCDPNYFDVCHRV